MAYKCLSCGHIFDECEIFEWEETHGFKNPPYERFEGCPICKNAFRPTVKCKICMGEFLKEELNGECVCDGCIENYKWNFEMCYKVADSEKNEVKINSLLCHLLDETDIETILYNHIKNKGDVNCLSFIESDKDWFAERLVEEVEKCQ
mgnify:CR=1 FL=1